MDTNLIWFLVELFQPFHGSPHGEVTVTIPANSNATAIGNELAKAGVISSGFFFDLRATLAGERGDLRAGTYRLQQGMTYGAVLKALTTAPPAAKTTNLTITEDLADETGVIIGSGIGGLTACHEQFKILFDRGPDRVSPFFITMFITDIAAGVVSMQIGARGPNFATVSACATSANAIGEAAEMIKRGGGKIINLASQAGVIALERHVAYCASKAAILSMTKVLALEWARHNIQVNAISPTVVLTELGKKAWAGEVGERAIHAAPEVTNGVPVVAVPLRPLGGEATQVVAVGLPDVPRLGDQFELG